MVAQAIAIDPTYRVVSARVPRVAIFEEVVQAEDLENVLAIEALTNDRLREAAGAIHLTPVADRVVGPGASFVMAPFAYVRPGRFSPAGMRGVYYAGESLETAIAETIYHRSRFFAATSELPTVIENRVIEAAIGGAFVAIDARERASAALLHPDSYEASFRFGADVYAGGHDGVRYPSVRFPAGTCLAVLRPRCVRDAHTTKYLGYRWDGNRINDVFEIRSLTNAYPDEPGAR